MKLYTPEYTDLISLGSAWVGDREIPALKVADLFYNALLEMDYYGQLGNSNVTDAELGDLSMCLTYHIFEMDVVGYFLERPRDTNERYRRMEARVYQALDEFYSWDDRNYDDPVLNAIENNVHGLLNEFSRRAYNEDLTDKQMDDFIYLQTDYEELDDEDW